MNIPRQPALDSVDRQILWRLDLNARTSMTSLARELRVSKQMLDYRLRRMSNAEILKGYIAIIDTHRLGHISFRVYFRFRSFDREREAFIIDYFVQHPHTLWVVSMNGVWDLEVVFTVRNAIHLSNLVKKMQLDLGRFFHRYDISFAPVTYHFRRDYLTDEKRKEFSTVYYGFEPKCEQWDSFDYALLSQLARDCKRPNEQIGRDLGLSFHTVKQRIGYLEAARVIQCYRPRVDFRKLGRRFMKALLTMASMDEATEKRFLYFSGSFNTVVYITEVLGDWQMEVEVEVEDAQEIHAIIRELRAAFPDLLLDHEIVEVTTEHKLNYFPIGIAESEEKSTSAADE